MDERTEHEPMEQVLYEVKRVIVGQDQLLERLVIALLARGHVLVEGVPGLAKTLAIRTLADTIGGQFHRIQFTPDLVPADLIGTRIYNQRTGDFATSLGPVFTNLLLADEINRAPAKVQSALLEVMQERHVTIGRETHAVPDPFLVMATQNPIESEGTYPLPEAQLDRFLLKVLLTAPAEDELVRILDRTTGLASTPPSPVVTHADVLGLQQLCRQIAVAEPVMRYIARIVAATDPGGKTAPERVKRAVRYGASVRGAQALALTAKAVALFEGRAHVSLKDVTTVALPALRHRLIRSFEGEADGVTPDAIVESVLEAVPSRPDAVEKAARGAE
jgi:MoxR-like ATPase